MFSPHGDSVKILMHAGKHPYIYLHMHANHRPWIYQVLDIGKWQYIYSLINDSSATRDFMNLSRQDANFFVLVMLFLVNTCIIHSGFLLNPSLQLCNIKSVSCDQAQMKQKDMVTLAVWQNICICIGILLYTANQCVLVSTLSSN